MDPLNLINPKLVAPLEEKFHPTILAKGAFKNTISEGAVLLKIDPQCGDGQLGYFKTKVFPQGHLRAVTSLPDSRSRK
jgi:hypothetical protein